MTKDDILKMAGESHLDVYGLGTDHKKFVSVIERFVIAVAAAERQAIIDELQKWHRTDKDRHNHWLFAINYIQGRGQQ